MLQTKGEGAVAETEVGSYFVANYPPFSVWTKEAASSDALPALLPFFVAEYELSYQQAAGLVFAATFASSVVQPLFGRYADRFSAAWLMPVGILAPRGGGRTGRAA